MSTESRYQVHTALSNLQPYYEQNETYEIENDGYAELPESNKRDVRIDHFASAPKYCELVEKQLEAFNLIDSWIEQSAPRTDVDFDDFSNSVFAGIIVIDNNFIKYADELTGEDVLLSKPSMPNGSVPLYQALSMFRELDAGSKRALKESTAVLLDKYPIPPEVAESVAVVENELSPAVLQRRLSAFTAANPAGTGEVRQVLLELKEKLSAFKSTYLNTL